MGIAYIPIGISSTPLGIDSLTKGNAVINFSVTAIQKRKAAMLKCIAALRI